MLKTASKTGYANIIKQLPTATAFIDTNFQITHASNTWLQFFELKAQNVVGKHLLEVFEKHDHTEWKKCLNKCFKGFTEHGLQHRTASTGGVKWFEWTNAPWYDDEENVIGAIVQIEEVTKRVEGEIKFEKLENLFKAQSEISNVGTWEYNLFTEEISWSDMTKKIHEVPLSYTPTIDAAIGFYKSGHDRNTIAMLVHNGINKGESWSSKSKIITEKGNEKWIVSAGKPLYKNGQVTRLVGTIQDITKQVNAEIKTKESEQLLRTLIDNLPLNVFIKDKESRKILVNKSECAYLGIKNPETLIGKSDFDLYDEEIASISRDEDVHVMKTQKSILGKRTVSVKRDGTSTSFLTSKIPWLDINGNSQGVIGLSLDISEMIQKEDQLRDLINVTAIQNKKLINFAHIVSHNLRKLYRHIYNTDDCRHQRSSIQVKFIVFWEFFAPPTKNVPKLNCQRTYENLKRQKDQKVAQQTIKHII